MSIAILIFAADCLLATVHCIRRRATLPFAVFSDVRVIALILLALAFGPLVWGIVRVLR
jgi:Ca2+/Na+ antiporter